MDITKARVLSIKYGLGINSEQNFSSEWGGFLRASWDDGKTETWNFTEIDQSLSFGLSLKGTSWRRPTDNLAFALLINGLSQDHRDYLSAGGIGFLIGDGKLNYAPEEIAEIYYLFNITKALDMTGDFQYVQHPAFNSDRGPVSICSLRLHYEI